MLNGNGLAVASVFRGHHEPADPPELSAGFARMVVHVEDAPDAKSAERQARRVWHDLASGDPALIGGQGNLSVNVVGKPSRKSGRIRSETRRGR
jgi:hypothetical protein